MSDESDTAFFTIFCYNMGITEKALIIENADPLWSAFLRSKEVTAVEDEVYMDEEVQKDMRYISNRLREVREDFGEYSARD